MHNYAFADNFFGKQAYQVWAYFTFGKAYFDDVYSYFQICLMLGVFGLYDWIVFMQK